MNKKNSQEAKLVASESGEIYQEAVLPSERSTIMKLLMFTLLLSLALGSVFGVPAPASEDSDDFMEIADTFDIEKRAVSKLTMYVHVHFKIDEYACSPGPSACLRSLYIMAFTSGHVHGGSDTSHAVEMRVNGVTRKRVLYDRPGDDMFNHKGDLWKINFSHFGFTDRCIRLSEIDALYIVENNDDGWNIVSVATFVEDVHGGVQVLTQDLEVNRWIDGDGLPSHRRFKLTKA